MIKIYYIDTNICIFYMRNPQGAVAKKLNSIPTELIKIPAIVKGELLVGAEKSKRHDETLAQTLAFCEPYEIVPFEDSMLRTYARIRAALERSGQKIGYNDTLIAATVLALNGTLVTNNVSEFARIDGLQCEDWTA
ncbi:MAG: type II toxin-antitoxin system VapC family toxin [Synergistaceae bacterium]|nr:type II toxin-antitoxin system VapC family toxin [Synergistaceae bacterium]